MWNRRTASGGRQEHDGRRKGDITDINGVMDGCDKLSRMPRTARAIETGTIYHAAARLGLEFTVRGPGRRDKNPQ
jgi:hypothetical protein